MVLDSYPFSLLSGYGRPSLLVLPPSGLNFCKFFPFFLLTFSSLLVVFAVLYIDFACVASFLASSGHKLLGPLAIGIFTPVVYFVLQLVSSYH